MRPILPLVCLLGAAAALTIDRRVPQDDSAAADYNEDDNDDGYEGDRPKYWRPKVKNPHFFNLVPDDSECFEPYPGVEAAAPDVAPDVDTPSVPVTPPGSAAAGPDGILGTADDGLIVDGSEVAPATITLAPKKKSSAEKSKRQSQYCPLNGYVIILEYGKVKAVPYRRAYRGKLTVFFVDDDEHLYTVSQRPLALYVDEATGQLQYANAGWVPPSAISTGFYHMGDNPERVLPSPGYLTWPTTYGIAGYLADWVFCPDGTGQYYVYANPYNWRGGQPTGIHPDFEATCIFRPLAALNTNPWSQQTTSPKVVIDVDGSW